MKIEITLRQEFSPVDLLHIFRITFLKNTSGGLLQQALSVFHSQNKMTDYEKISYNFAICFLYHFYVHLLEKYLSKKIIYQKIFLFVVF